jgi:hypothetical protein
MVFHIATSLLAIFIVGYLLINGLDPKFASGGTSFATRATIEQLVGIHPTYLSLLMAFSVLSIGRNTLNTKTIILNELFQILLLLIVIVLLSSKMVFIALGIITPIIVIYSPFKKLIKALSLIGFYISILLSIIFIPVLNQRFIELKSNWQNIPTESNANATNQRTAIYHCSWEVLKNNFWLGTGTAAQQDELNQCFDSTGISKLSAQKFNTHNEYLNVATALGLPGVISFFALLFYSFKKATKNPNHLLLLSLFCIVCLTENLLARHYGVFFFGILNFYYIFGKNGQTQN